MNRSRRIHSSPDLQSAARGLFLAHRFYKFCLLTLTQSKTLHLYLLSFGPIRWETARLAPVSLALCGLPYHQQERRLTRVAAAKLEMSIVSVTGPAAYLWGIYAVSAPCLCLTTLHVEVWNWMRGVDRSQHGVTVPALSSLFHIHISSFEPNIRTLCPQHLSRVQGVRVPVPVC